MVYNIAVFGSCASRDNFYSGINPDYKKYFNCPVSSQRGSIISLMQEPVPFKNQDIPLLTSKYPSGSVFYLYQPCGSRVQCPSR